MDTRSMDAFAVAAPGLAPLVAMELDRLGLAPREVTPDGVAFDADWRALAVANLWLRTATRVLVRVARFRATSFRELEQHGRRVDWARVVAPGQPVALRVTCRKSRLWHSDAVAQRVHEAIAHVHGAPVPLVAGADDEHEGDDDAAVQRLVVRVAHDEVTISADASGAPLHKRGWRTALAKAPMRETLAAACLLAAGYDPAAPVAFLDPLCGAGTLPIEAALLATGRAPGRWRRFAFEQWRGVPPSLLSKAIRDTAADGRATCDVPVVASDRDPGAVRMARENAERAGVGDIVRIEQRDLRDAVPPAAEGLWVSNAPWGKRVGAAADLRTLFATVGALAQHAFAPWRVALLVGDERHLRETGVAYTRVLATRAGGLPVLLGGLET